jgi:hypothetical protein
MGTVAPWLRTRRITTTTCSIGSKSGPKRPGSIRKGEPGEGVPWHLVLLLLVGVALLFALEVTLVLTITKAVTGQA